MGPIKRQGFVIKLEEGNDLVTHSIPFNFNGCKKNLKSLEKVGAAVKDTDTRLGLRCQAFRKRKKENKLQQSDKKMYMVQNRSGGFIPYVSQKTLLT